MFGPRNLSVYAYAHQRPTFAVDRDGRYSVSQAWDATVDWSKRAWQAWSDFNQIPITGEVDKPVCFSEAQCMGALQAYGATTYKGHYTVGEALMLAGALGEAVSLLGIAAEGTGGAAAVARAGTAAEAASTGRALVPYYPANGGFLGEATQTTLQTGQTIDRYGGGAISRFFSPAGTPAAMRALPPGVVNQPLRSFEVLQPFSGRIWNCRPLFWAARAWCAI